MRIQKAILTKYRPTNIRGDTRISAEINGTRIYVPYDHEKDLDANHAAAAVALIKKLKWSWAPNSIAHGVLPDESHVHVSYLHDKLREQY